MTVRAWLAILVLAATPGVAAGQDLTARILGGGDGVVRLGYPARPGVEICENGVRLFGDRMNWSGGRYRDGECRTGPVQVDLRVREGRVTRVDILRLGEEGATDARDLGAVGAEEALGAFLRLAREGGGRRHGDLIFPAVLADVEDSWRRVLGLAEDREAPSHARKSALFWVGQEAAAAATEGLARVAAGEDEEQEVRNAAIFALSQRSPDQSVPVLMELARTGREGETRRTAFFWLAQMDDPRVPDFFREVLRGGGSR